MLPGATDTKCITVTANASVPSTVKGYAVNPVTSPQKLENRIKVTIESGTGGSFADCTGFVAGRPGPRHQRAAVDHRAGRTPSRPASVAGPSPRASPTRPTGMTWTFDTAGMTQAEIDQLQGATTGIDMQWEMRTNG